MAPPREISQVLICGRRREGSRSERLGNSEICGVEVRLRRSAGFPQDWIEQNLSLSPYERSIYPEIGDAPEDPASRNSSSVEGSMDLFHTGGPSPGRRARRPRQKAIPL